MSDECANDTNNDGECILCYHWGGCESFHGSDGDRDVSESPRVVQTWDSLPPVVKADGESVSTRVLEHKYRETLSVALALREYIDAIPSDVEFSVGMPGVDRDWVDRVLDQKGQA